MTKLDPDRIPAIARGVCQALADAGGHAWLVGGVVRDLLLPPARTSRYGGYNSGQVPGDPDIEVYGLAPDALRKILADLGKVELTGRKFGVFKLWKDGRCIDIAVPRTERKTKTGHKGFDVTADPGLDPETASLRRDFTVNAMMFDPLSGRLLDFSGGRADLAAGILRHVSPAFAEDPLRVLRGMQFAARFRLELDHDTATLCQNLLPEADALPVSRIWNEWQKWAHASFPSYGLDALEQSGWLTLYPMLAALKDCPQEREWHPEGNVWTHTKLVVDQAVHVAERHPWQNEEREYLLFAALCHDMGKPVTTLTDETGRIRSSGHSEEGAAPAHAFFAAVGAPKRVEKYVVPLVREHLVHLHGQPTPRAVRRLAHRLEPASIQLWESLVEADASGRPPLAPGRPALSWLKEAQRIAVETGKPRPLATGKMLMELGMQPGPEMGRLLKEAFEAQLDGEFDDESDAYGWLSHKLGEG